MSTIDESPFVLVNKLNTNTLITHIIQGSFLSANELCYVLARNTTISIAVEEHNEFKTLFEFPVCDPVAHLLLFHTSSDSAKKSEQSVLFVLTSAGFYSFLFYDNTTSIPFPKHSLNRICVLSSGNIVQPMSQLAPSTWEVSISEDSSVLLTTSGPTGYVFFLSPYGVPYTQIYTLQFPAPVLSHVLTGSHSSLRVWALLDLPHRMVYVYALTAVEAHLSLLLKHASPFAQLPIPSVPLSPPSLQLSSYVQLRAATTAYALALSHAHIAILAPGAICVLSLPALLHCEFSGRAELVPRSAALTTLADMVHCRVLPAGEAVSLWLCVSAQGEVCVVAAHTHSHEDAPPAVSTAVFSIGQVSDARCACVAQSPSPSRAHVPLTPPIATPHQTSPSHASSPVQLSASLIAAARGLSLLTTSLSGETACYALATALPATEAVAMADHPPSATDTDAACAAAPPVTLHQRWRTNDMGPIVDLAVDAATGDRRTVFAVGGVGSAGALWACERGAVVRHESQPVDVPAGAAVHAMHRLSATRLPLAASPLAVGTEYNAASDTPRVSVESAAAVSVGAAVTTLVYSETEEGNEGGEGALVESVWEGVSGAGEDVEEEGEEEEGSVFPLFHGVVGHVYRVDTPITAVAAPSPPPPTTTTVAAIVASATTARLSFAAVPATGAGPTEHAVPPRAYRARTLAAHAFACLTYGTVRATPLDDEAAATLPPALLSVADRAAITHAAATAAGQLVVALSVTVPPEASEPTSSLCFPAAEAVAAAYATGDESMQPQMSSVELLALLAPDASSPCRARCLLLLISVPSFIHAEASGAVEGVPCSTTITPTLNAVLPLPCLPATLALPALAPPALVFSTQLPHTLALSRACSTLASCFHHLTDAPPTPGDGITCTLVSAPAPTLFLALPHLPVLLFLTLPTLAISHILPIALPATPAAPPTLYLDHHARPHALSPHTLPAPLSPAALTATVARIAAWRDALVRTGPLTVTSLAAAQLHPSSAFARSTDDRVRMRSHKRAISMLPTASRSVQALPSLPLSLAALTLAVATDAGQCLLFSLNACPTAHARALATNPPSESVPPSAAHGPLLLWRVSEPSVRVCPHPATLSVVTTRMLARSVRAQGTSPEEVPDADAPVADGTSMDVDLGVSGNARHNAGEGEASLLALKTETIATATATPVTRAASRAAATTATVVHAHVAVGGSHPMLLSLSLAPPAIVLTLSAFPARTHAHPIAALACVLIDPDIRTHARTDAAEAPQPPSLALLPLLSPTLLSLTLFHHSRFPNALLLAAPNTLTFATILPAPRLLTQRHALAEQPHRIALCPSPRLLAILTLVPAHNASFAPIPIAPAPLSDPAAARASTPTSAAAATLDSPVFTLPGSAQQYTFALPPAQLPRHEAFVRFYDPTSLQHVVSLRLQPFEEALCVAALPLPRLHPMETTDIHHHRFQHTYTHAPATRGPSPGTAFGLSSSMDLACACSDCLGGQAVATGPHVIAVGTAVVHASERKPTLGRILILHVDPASRRLRVLSSRLVRGAVMSICGYRGGLLASINSLVRLYALHNPIDAPPPTVAVPGAESPTADSNSTAVVPPTLMLVPFAAYSAPSLVLSLRTRHNYIYVTTLAHAEHVVAYRPASGALEVVAREDECRWLTAALPLSDNVVLCADDSGNVLTLARKMSVASCLLTAQHDACAHTATSVPNDAPVPALRRVLMARCAMLSGSPFLPVPTLARQQVAITASCPQLLDAVGLDASVLRLSVVGGVCLSEVINCFAWNGPQRTADADTQWLYSSASSLALPEGLQRLLAASHPHGQCFDAAELREAFTPPPTHALAGSRTGALFAFKNMTTRQYTFVRALHTAILAVSAADAATVAELRRRVASRKRKQLESTKENHRAPLLPPQWRPTLPSGEVFSPLDLRSVGAWHTAASTVLGHSALLAESTDRQSGVVASSADAGGSAAGAPLHVADMVRALVSPSVAAPSAGPAAAAPATSLGQDLERNARMLEMPVFLSPTSPSAGTNALVHADVLRLLLQMPGRSLLDVALCVTSWAAGGATEGREEEMLHTGQGLVPLLIKYAQLVIQE